jgi:60S ribosome subunit biogenesis protein NIP7
MNRNLAMTRLIHCFRENIMRKATNVARENLVSLGTCFGKMTKSGKFRMHITALDFLAPYAKVSVQI